MRMLFWRICSNRQYKYQDNKNGKGSRRLVCDNIHSKISQEGKRKEIKNFAQCVFPSMESCQQFRLLECNDTQWSCDLFHIGLGPKNSYQLDGKRRAWRISLGKRSVNCSSCKKRQGPTCKESVLLSRRNCHSFSNQQPKG